MEAARGGGRKGSGGVRELTGWKCGPRPPYLRVSTLLPRLHPRPALQLSRSCIPRLPRGDQAHTPPGISCADNSSFSFTWEGVETWEGNTLASLNDPPIPNKLPSARLKRGDRAGHQTGKGRRCSRATGAGGYHATINGKTDLFPHHLPPCAKAHGIGGRGAGPAAGTVKAVWPSFSAGAARGTWS